MVQIDKMHPGICLEPESKDSRLTKARVEQVAKFITENGYYRWSFGDLGSENIMSTMLAEKLDASIFRINADDFNWDELPERLPTCKTITCFEILEHLTNPLFFMFQLSKLMESDSILYLSMPCRPKIFWTPHHFYEMSGDHMQKWLLTPLGLKIVTKKKLRYVKHWTDYLIGFRPLVRAIINWDFYPILASLNNTSYIYKIVKEQHCV